MITCNFREHGYVRPPLCGGLAISFPFERGPKARDLTAAGPRDVTAEGGARGYGPRR